MSDVGRAITAAMRLQRERDLRRMAWDLRLLGPVDVNLSLRFRAWCMWGWYLDNGGMGTPGYYADGGTL